MIDIQNVQAEASVDLFEASDAVLDRLPPVLRILSLTRTLEGNRILTRAVLYHCKGSLTVEWVANHVDTRIHRYGLAIIKRAASIHSENGALRIQRLIPADHPLPSFNLFETIPPKWLKDGTLTNRAAVLWEALPRALAHLVNAVLWDSHRLHRFVTGPSSLSNHHCELGGNFRHSVEVAERAQMIAHTSPGVEPSLLIAAGLLHDVAKAAEYSYDRESRRFRLSDRGQLIGHRDTLIEWLAVARETGKVILDESTWLKLLHTLNAVRGAPTWIGLREPRGLEADILSTADRLSGNISRFQQVVNS